MTARGRLSLALLLLGALLLVATGLRRTDDLTRLLPADGSLGDAARAAFAHDAADTLLFEVDGAGASREALAQAVAEVAERARESSSFTRVRSGVEAGDGAAIQQVAARHAVALLPEEVLQERTSEDGVRQALQRWKARMAGPAGAIAARGLLEDPLDLGGLALDRIRATAGPWSVQVEDGLLLDDSGTRALVLATPARGAIAGAEDVGLEAAARAVADGGPLPVRWFGGPRVATDMAATVQRDVAVAGGLAAIVLTGVLLVGFASFRPVVGLLLPLSLSLSAVAAALALRSPVHGITLGFGGALVGIAVDYWIHLSVAAARRYDGPDPDRRQEAAEAAWRDIRGPVLASALTTCSAFGILLLSRFPVVGDLGAAGVAAILGAVAGTALLGPLAYRWIGGRAARWQLPQLPRSMAWGALAVTVLLGIVATGLRFEGDPRRLIAVSDETAALERELAARYGGIGTGGLAVARGAHTDEALDLAAQATAVLEGLPGVTVGGPSALLPGPALAARRLAALPDPEVLAQRIAAAAVEVGLRPEALLGALDGYYTGGAPAPDAWADTPLRQVVDQALGEGAVGLQVTFIDPGVAREARRVLPEGVTLVVPTALAAEGVAAIRDELVSLGGLAVALGALLLLARYRDPRRVLAAGLPPLAAIAWTLGAMALLGWPLDAVGTSVLVLILGLAVDYGIFMTDGRRHGPAVSLGAVTSIAGFGTLLASRSPGLAGAGLVVLAGLGGAAVVALTVTPLVAEGALLGRRTRRLARVVGLGGIVAVHLQVLVVLRFVAAPPEAEPVQLPADRHLEGPDRRLGPHRLLQRHGVWTLSVSGPHHELGLAHGLLTADLRARLEEETIDAFTRAVPSPLARAAILQGVMVVGAGLDAHVDRRWAQEIAGLVASTPDPLGWAMPGYTRKLYMHALHDIGQALVDSPLVACTGFLAGGAATADGHWILARNFDFEGGRVFDDDKVVIVRRPDDGLATVSVSFPGMVGVVSGINEARLAVALQAAGSDASIRMAQPMTLVLREVLEEARTLDEVERVLERTRGFATEVILAVDGARGEAAVFEVTPDRVVRLPAGELLGVSNHLRSEAFAADQENRRRQEEQTTGPRLQRVEALIADHRGTLDLPTAVEILRDRQGPAGEPLPRGHRWALDADIATHAVAIDATAGELWVSVSPNLAGGFVAYRLDDLLAGDLEPELAVPPADAGGALATHRGRALLREAKHLRGAEREARLQDALRYLPGHPEALLDLAEHLIATGRLEEARPLLAEAERATPEHARDRARLARLQGRL